jgi:serine/threonine-protein kinase
MGVVYRAVQKSLKREVAIKILAPKWAQHARFLQRFFREAKLAAELKHPNVVGAIDVGESNGLHYYAMEYVDGWSVAEMLKEDGVFDEAEALDIALQVAKALEHAAEHHIVHRDVKPENILVTPDGVAKLADLGLSKQLTSDCSLTTEGKTLGTPFYVSPELARGQRDIDVRSDIYSLGATLYHMLAGEPPFVGDNPAAIMARHIAEEAVPLKRRRRDISLATSRLIEKMMAKDPARRYATAADLIEDIIAIRKGKNPFAAVPREPAEAGGARAAAPVARSRRGVVSPPERPGYGACFGRRVRASAAAIGAGALAVVAVLGIAYSYRSGRAPAPPPDPRAAFGPSAPAAAPATPAPDSVREAAAQTRLATVREIVEMRLDQGRYDEATEAIEALERDVAGTAAEAPARELRERVRRESDRALELALRKARHDLGSGRPDLALEILRDSPASRKPELEAEKARLRAEAERALREEKPVR